MTVCVRDCDQRDEKGHLPGFCPTPWKLRFDSHIAARRYGRKIRNRSEIPYLRVYLCRCGARHLTSNQPRSRHDVTDGNGAA
jgi:hypothetical protein